MVDEKSDVPLVAGYVERPLPKGESVGINHRTFLVEEPIYVQPDNIDPKNWAVEAEATIARTFKAPSNEVIVEILHQYFGDYLGRVDRAARIQAGAEIQAMSIAIVDDDRSPLERAVDLRDQIAQRFRRP